MKYQDENGNMILCFFLFLVVHILVQSCDKLSSSPWFANVSLFILAGSKSTYFQHVSSLCTERADTTKVSKILPLTFKDLNSQIQGINYVFRIEESNCESFYLVCACSSVWRVLLHICSCVLDSYSHICHKL